MQLPRRSPPVERLLRRDRCVPAEDGETLFEVRRRPEHLHCPMHAAIREGSPHNAGLLIDPVLLPQPVRCLVDEEDAAAGRQEAAQDAPERLETARGHVGQEEAEEHHVLVVRRLHGEGIGHPILDGPLPHLGPVELKHLWRGIGDDELVGVLGQKAGPLAGAGSQLEDATARLERPQRVADAIRTVCEGVVLGRGGGVVLRGAFAVVGDLLVDELLVRHQRRSAGTPSVTAAATVAVASARAWPEESAASPPKSWVAALGMAARISGTRVQPSTSTVGAVAPGNLSMRVATAVSTPRNAERSRIRITAGWSLAPEASTRLTTPW